MKIKFLYRKKSNAFKYDACAICNKNNKSTKMLLKKSTKRNKINTVTKI